MSLVNLLKEIRADLAGISEVARVYNEVPDSMNEMPAIVVASLGARCWMDAHTSDSGNAPMACEHHIRVEVHVPRKDLAWATERINAIAPAVALRLYSGFVRDRFSGTMVTVGDPRATNSQGMLDYEIGPSEWDAVKTYAMACDFRVTTREKVLT